MDLILPWEACLRQYRYKYLALYHALRSAIHEGTLPGGTRLPSSRELAQLYGISRGSVAQAYDMLLAEGYVLPEVGKGTYVAPLLTGVTERTPAQAELPLSPWGRRMLDWQLVSRDHHAGLREGNRIKSAARTDIDRGRISFAEGGGDMRHFPHAEWRSALAYAGKEAVASEAALIPEDPFGDEGLRAAIAAHLRRSRGITAEPAQICLFSGSMQAIALLTQLLLGKGEPAVVEDPGYHGIVKAVRACGGRPLPAAIDGSGIVPQDWQARLLFVTPGRQFPTGAVLSSPRRQELLAWARRKDAVIIEDDYDSEFRWGGRPLEPLKALDKDERVVYIGTFTKTMFASLRIGYAVLPPGLITPMRCAKALYEPTPPAALEQRALARFMIRGEYDRHLRRMRRIYHARHDALCSLLSAGEMQKLFRVLPADAGLHIYALWHRSEAEFQQLCELSAGNGVDFRDARAYGLIPSLPAACFSFAHLDIHELAEGIQRLTKSWRLVQEKLNTRYT
ncbi:PLP-dependent aminotransferase family protein [Paenibacillus sp. YPG26]|uniref:MocR-like pyridoxine biosynthesis transcription factor PdxR n=1 Tax=Paenibacillus sp. YPG26 TaxID=2878915 RepID=UPI00203AEE17|nr:PLP-dependent aminotransferase family protein [Paenibacillus sp. YPG26]USB32502.1 PLP-dependent aminotransferase family protein [Paenibacillus sp. YPG26]